MPQKIWPDYNWNELKVVLIYPSRDQSWIWDTSTNSIDAIANSKLPPSAIGSTYDFFEIGGRRALSLNMEEKDTDHFGFGVHEFFHNHGQRDWDDVSGGRGTEYPVTWQPRFYRRMIFDNLKRYLDSDQAADLGRAKYWYNNWSSLYPKEVISTTDGYEGTAQYAETIAKTIVEKGCAATDAQLKANILSKMKGGFIFSGLSLSAQEFGLDSEGYEIGALAAVVLRFANRDLREWTVRMSKGTTPLQVLLERVPAVTEEAPKALLETFEAAAKRINSERGALLDQSIANWANKNFIRVAMPYRWLQSNLMPSFFARSTILDLELYPLSTEHQYVAPSGGSNFKAKAKTVIFEFQTPVCSEWSSYAIVSSDQVNLTGKHATVASPTINGRLVGELKMDNQGFKYICVK